MVLLCFWLHFLDHYVFICFMGIQTSQILISLSTFVKLFLFHLSGVYSIFSFCHSKSVSILVYLALCLYRLIFVAYIKGAPSSSRFWWVQPRGSKSRKSDSGRKVMSRYLFPSPYETGHTFTEVPLSSTTTLLSSSSSIYSLPVSLGFRNGVSLLLIAIGYLTFPC